MTVEVSTPHRFRTLVIWCPDWPAVAGARQLGTPSSGPVAVFKANRVVTCTAAARAEGIVVGQRRRDAQSRCPDLLVVAADPDRDARLFEPVVAAVESVAPGVEILRPGMIACSARGPAKYFGGEAEAAERIVDIVEALDVECRIGIADSLAVAVLAARYTRIVPSGGSAGFCAPLPVIELARDPAIAPPERAQLVDLLIRLGITTAGQFAALPQNKVATRFGADAVIAHLLAAGAADRGMSRRVIPEDLAVQQFCDPPLDRVDTAAFAARALAELFHARLADAGLACTRLAITATTDRGQSLSRIWRCAKPLTPAATADRLRWQLDGWLTAGRTVRRADVEGNSDEGSQGPGAITMLRLEPIEAIGAGLVQYGLWGSDGEGDQRAGWAFARVQGLLGPESVLGPVLDGGRGPIDRITLVPWGEEKTPVRDPAAPWPGALPAPSPTRVSAAADLASAGSGNLAATLSDEDGLPVTVTSRGLLSGTPVRVTGAGVEASLIRGWAGPWLLDERWWRPNGSIRAAAHPSSTAVAASRFAASKSPASRSPASRSPASRSPASRSPASGQEPGAYSMGPYDSAYAKPERGIPVKPAAAPQAHPLPSPGIGSTLTAPAKHQARLQILPERGPALLLLFGVDGWQIEGRYD